MADFQHRRRAPSAYARIRNQLTGDAIASRLELATGTTFRRSHEHHRACWNKFVFQRCNGILVVLAISNGASQ